MPPITNYSEGAKSKESCATTTNNADAPKMNTLQALLAKVIAGDSTSNSSSLANCMFYTFSIFSVLVTILPTSLLPLALMSYGITCRLIPHWPTFQPKNTSNASITAIQHYQFGLLYLSLGFHFILQISKQPIHIGNLLFVVWMSDTGALIFGRLMKSNKLEDTTELDNGKCGIFLSFLRSISPGKTCPGLLGALVTGPLCALIYPISLPLTTTYESEEQCNDGESALNVLGNFFNHPLFQKAILGLILALSGIVGDLAESSVKRLSRKKDSGGLLPGHGGVVDRFDSLFVAAVVYYYLVLA